MTLHHIKHHQTSASTLNAAGVAYTKAFTPKERITFPGRPEVQWRRTLQPLHLLEEPRARPLGIQASGWCWLEYNTQATKRLVIATMPNQDPLLCLVPIGIDSWEHAFYFQYLNFKHDYPNAIWNVINTSKRLRPPRRGFGLLQALSAVTAMNPMCERKQREGSETNYTCIVCL
ncbi:manganese superoxide dismutase [Ephemerocybe angulata]|uniref:superoxide dismutase n=1 Tax=Ephemerocybe angulata TaxID=980116 RepID=A0A8H6LZS3_9AGAR|nr:manganese superoxide dismutase [Tulosesus angulatus]